MHDAQIRDPDAIFRYVMGGRAVLTLVSSASGQRFTFSVEMKTVRQLDNESDEKFEARRREAMSGVRFVKVLTGPDNTHDYSYIGHINDRREFRLDRRSAFDASAPSVRAWMWFWSVLTNHREKLDQIEVWHNGRCSRCGRELTVPESVQSGLGPVCAESMGGFRLAPVIRTNPLSFNPRGTLTPRSAEAVR